MTPPHPIQPATYEELLPIKRDAARDAIYIKPTTSYLAYHSSTAARIIGICGYTLHQNGKTAKYRNDWVHPAFRKLGIYAQLNDARTKLMRKLAVERVIVTCTPDSLPLHLKLGGRITRRFKHATTVEHTL